jgi:hypothetical protein
MSARLSECEGAAYPDHERLDHPRLQLARRIERLRAAGAARWDAPAFSLLTSLQARIERDGGEGGRTLSWALDRCDALERWMDETSIAVEAFTTGDAVGRADVLVMLERGDLPSAQVVAALAAFAPRARRSARPALLVDGERLEASLLEARTAAVSAQAHSAGIEPSGPYNPTSLAGKLLSSIDDLAPSYLRACVEALHDLAVLQRTETEAAAPKPRRSRPPTRRTSIPPRKP